MIKVYHWVAQRDDIRGLFFGIDGTRAALIERGEDPDYKYVLAATVNTSSIDEAYQLTNHIDHEWWRNRLVTVPPSNWPGKPSKRSTSVGDMMVVDDSEIRELVVGMGFEQFTREQMVIPRQPTGYVGGRRA